jgi:hypothetical protein
MVPSAPQLPAGQAEKRKPGTRPGTSPGALQGDDYQLDYYPDGYPKLPVCLRRAPAADDEMVLPARQRRTRLHESFSRRPSAQ